jgi:metallo-beta-lactamase class B
MLGNHRFVSAFFAVLFLAGWVACDAHAQNTVTAGDSHAASAMTATHRPGHDFSQLYDQLCGERPPRRTMIVNGALQMDPDPAGGGGSGPGTPPRSEWYQPPSKVFDNLYYVGSQLESMWALTTSEGIILHDTAYEYMVDPQIVDGLRAFGLNPADIKYVIIGHGHSDHIRGARQLQDRYGAKVIMAERDWEMVENSNTREEIKPRRDIVATDGMKLTLGDTTLTLYLTPGHTPGTISTLFPLKDGNRRHVGALWGGTAFGFAHYPDAIEGVSIYRASAVRFRDIALEARADVHLSSHTNYDKTLEKLNALRFRKPGDPHPFVSQEAVERYQDVLIKCSDATLEWLTEVQRRGLSLRHPVESGLR